MARRTLLVTYIATYLLAVGSIIRYLVHFRDDHLGSLAVLVSGYLVLLLLEPLFVRRNRLLAFVYLLVQTAIICTISVAAPGVDFWAVLFCPLVVQVMHNFPQGTGFLITGAFTLITSVFLLLGLGLEMGLPLVLVYAAVFFLLAAFIGIILEAVAAREESEKQQAELQAAHWQLQTYTARAEELAVLQERNRLARELHDSVTQSLYSVTLFAEAARHRAEVAGHEQIEFQIRQIGRICLQALKEMRLLVFELRPPELKEEGLVRALRKRLEAVEGRASVEARVVVDADDFVRLPRGVELELYRIAQEALNNALKHSNASSVVVHLRREDGRVEMEVEDDGLGFEPEAVRGGGGAGLESIRQRAEGLGGTATVHSAPGEGTRVKVTVDMKEEAHG